MTPTRPQKVLILGSGALKIGEAGEFDYSGSQGIKALREEGIRTVLINPNIATIQTSEFLADEVYFLPVDVEHVTRVIERERPDGMLLSFGGQTALNCGIALDDAGVLERHGVRVLGTPLDAIRMTEDRQAFADTLRSIELKTPQSEAVSSLEAAIEAADRIGYPVMLRVAFALGGKGSGIARNREQLVETVTRALATAPQILVEEYLEGWKEVEYEIVRDAFDNCIAVCNMENFDSLGIHTGESIVVAPSQTLTNHEYHKLRAISIRLVRHVGVVGECNVQFALHPHSDDYRIIELNARLSRSSALASKATGYPLAYVAAKLALGKSLTEVPNAITRRTYSCFEPALDYCVVKMPRWDLKKFRRVAREIGSEMKSVGEVMAIGRRFEEAIQKACRMLDIGALGVFGGVEPPRDLEEELRHPTENRLFAIAEALRQGMSVERIHELTRITPWFLDRLAEIVQLAESLRGRPLEAVDADTMRQAKELGFSDAQLAELLDLGPGERSRHMAELAVRDRRLALEVRPVVKQIDTLAAEWPAQTNYLYLTYLGTENDIEPAAETERPHIVLGGGCYRIGSSVEFDWCCVTAARTLQAQGRVAVMVNCNPETVSTDYDTCDRLYFEELTLERVLDICDMERPAGVMLSFGGQTPNNLAVPLGARGVPILGTDVADIDQAENRKRFSALLDALGIDQPEWQEARSVEQALAFAREAGYPVLIRPSYVLSGAAMSVAHSDEELVNYLGAAARVSPDYPTVVSKFITNAKELEFDGVALGGRIVREAITEHVENAGVHSGDATMVFPAQRVYLETVRRIRRTAEKIAHALRITGPFNIQFLAVANHLRVIECNLRASRSFPFVSKVLRDNFIDAAVRGMLGAEVPPPARSGFELDYVGVKAPQFSFARLKGADPLLGVEMASTGEVACLGDDVHEAYLRALEAVGYSLPRTGVLLSTGTLEQKVSFLGAARTLAELGLPLYATAGTHAFLAENGIASERVGWPLECAEDDPNNATFLIRSGRVDLVINVPKSFERDELSNDYLIRRTAVDFGASLFTNIQAAALFVEALAALPDPAAAPVKPWREYA
ncbi:MAG: carbamoyl-phosphate synthase (glutamine-hydrolyzing) large subunit [Planctomycetota bacterium]|nr:MAG: carbamoyl-phosphate synthase (glutamine-hydrolyzing) large subunit [Planctomycetota bacterium]